jgi:uncharacterized protein YcnI
MRCSGWSSLAISACSAVAALVLVGAAGAHVVADPTYVASKGSEAILLAVPNEREKPMTSFVVKTPVGLEIEHAHPAPGWDESVDGTSSVTWSGGSLAPRKEVGFRVTLKADAQPGTLDLDAEQHYPDGGIVQWPVTLTILPPAKSPSQNLALAGVVGLIGLLTIAAIFMLARRRPQKPRAAG